MVKYVTVREAKDDMIRRMRFVYWITKVIDTHSECVILIGFPRLQRLGERTLVLHVCIHCLSCCTYECNPF